MVDEVVGKRVQGHTYTLPWRASYSHVLLGCNRTMYESVRPERAIGRVWYLGSQWCAKCNDRKGVWTYHHDHTDYLPKNPSMYLYVHEWSWYYSECETLICLHIHRWRLHCTDGRQIDYRQISVSSERVRSSSYSWWPECWIPVRLLDYGQHPTKLI